MPANLPQKALDDARTAISHAQKVRRYHRRRTMRNSQQRVTDIKLGLARLKEAMAPLRTEIGRFPYGPATDSAEANRETIREASRALQEERRKLHKMLPKGKK